MTKKEVRVQMKKAKAQLSEEDREQLSKQIITSFMKNPIFVNAKQIYCYVSYNQEVNTHEFIRMALALGKKVAVPKVISKEEHKMVFYNITSLNDLEVGYQGILEPTEDQEITDQAGIMLLPGLAFDITGNRLGYGGGFYDRYVNENNTFTLISFAFDFQVLHQVPIESNDHKIQYLFTPTKRYEF